MSGPHRVTLQVATPADVLPHYYPNGKLGGLSVGGAAPVALGDAVHLTVKVRRPAREFEFFGRLAWARRKGSRRLEQGFGVDFLPADDSTRTRLLAFARSEVGPEATRLDHRLQVEWPIKLVHRQTTRRERLADLSPGGAFVRTWDPLELDAQVEIVVRLPKSLFAVHLPGRVAWVRRAGEAPGMGIQFTELDGALRRDIDTLLSRLTAP